MILGHGRSFILIKRGLSGQGSFLRKINMYHSHDWKKSKSFLA